jgi:hypothetical protein
LNIGFMQRNLENFWERGALPSQRSDRKGNCLRWSVRVLPLQRSETMHGRERFYQSLQLKRYKTLEQ